jgi:4-amino-4-deoxy-L-arabinose transferase
MKLPAALLPWTFLVPASIAGLRANGIKTPLLRYAICWFVFPFLLFSISSGKLLTYILPCFPALAILLSTGIIEYLNTEKTYWFNKGVFFLMGFMGLLIVCLLILQTGMIAPLHPYAYEAQWKEALFFAALIIFIIVLKSSLITADHTKKILIFAAAPLFFYLSAHFLIPDLTFLRKCPGELIQRNMDRIDKDVLVFSPSTPLRAVNWFLKRDDVFMLSQGELVYGLKQKGYKNRLVSYQQFYELVRKNNGKKKIAIIIDQWDYARIKDNLPESAYMDSSGDDGFAFIIF